MSRLRMVARRLVEKAGLQGVAFRAQEYLRAFTSRDRDVRSNDGIAVPNAHLIVSVGGHANATAFLDGGRDVADAICAILNARGVKLAELKTVLDFGCGCGREWRHWRNLPESVAIHGTDYNRRAVAWCSRNLPFVHTMVN